jgi:hypothetical protein
MADDKAQQDDQEKKVKEIKEKFDKVESIVHQAIESNQLPDAVDKRSLDELSAVLDKIKKRIPPPPQGDHGDSGANKDGQEEEFLPSSKVDELKLLLEEIERALQSPKQPKSSSSEHDIIVQGKKKLLSAVTGCNPFSKVRPQEKKGSSTEQGGDKPQEEDEAVSLKLLVRLAQHVLEPEQYYEWTTSYVDESRIYGWDDEAGEVVDALVGPEDGDFRAAAITGIHGSGKTALAQKVFVHDKVKDHFPIRLWVCVGPPDSEDRFNLLYRMLDNLGLDTNEVEDVIVHNAKVVQEKRDQEKKRILLDEKAEKDMRKKAGDIFAKKDSDGTAKEITEEKVDEEFKKLLAEEVEESHAVVSSKIGVLLYILHVTLSKTGYLIVFDDIRVYGDDGWYNNLTLPPPPPDKEWSDRLAYGLPKTATKHRCAVLVTCRKEDDAKAMVRNGRVFRPPKLEVDNGWRLFDREYKRAKEEDRAKKDMKDQNASKEEEKDLLFQELEEMKKDIVDKCLGLPVAIIEAAKGFALSGLDPLPDPPEKPAVVQDPLPGKQTAGSSSNKEEQTAAADDDKPEAE